VPRWCQQHAELAGCYVALGGQLLVKGLEARIELPHEKAKFLVELERAGNVLG
jgi:hypothetical protein